MRNRNEGAPFFLLSALIALAGALHAESTTLLPYGSVWHYLDDGSDQGIAWRSAAFGDSAWASGPGQLGYGDAATTVGYIDTDPVTAVDQKNATTYFRTTVNIPDPTLFTGIRLTLLYDDAGAVFINGTEVARTANLPANAAFDTFATSTSSDNATQSWLLPTTAFVAGVNTIAVEIHQASATSSDISFDLRLLGISEVTRGPYLLMNNSSAVTLRWRTNSPSDSVVSIGAAPGALTTSTTVAIVTTEHEVRVTGLLPDSKYFYSVGTTSAVPGTDRPLRIRAVGDSGTGNSNQQAVRDAFHARAGCRGIRTRRRAVQRRAHRLDRRCAQRAGHP